MNKLVEAIKANEHIKAPIWAPFVKTGVSKERPPVDPDWWYVRVASVLKKVRKYGPIGANKLAKFYGGRQNRGHKTDIKKDGSRNIVRKSLQQLESAGFIKQVSDKKYGKVITKEGSDLLKSSEN